MKNQVLRSNDRELSKRLDQALMEVKKYQIALQRTSDELVHLSHSISHDLKAPLRAIDGFSRILDEQYAEALPEEAINYLKTIRLAAKKMNALIDNMVVLAKLEDYAIEPKSISMNEIVNEVIKTKKDKIDKQTVSINVSELPDANVDKNLMHLAWEHLIDNAIKFTQIKENPAVEIGVIYEGGDTIYYIKDNGVGFKMDYVHKLFKLFKRLHTEEMYDGVGSGLAITQKIINKHHGSIWAKAMENKGATFYFTLEDNLERYDKN